MTPSDLVTVPDAARIARLSVHTIRRWIHTGRVRLYGHPGSYRVPLSDVLPPATSKRAKLYYTPDGKAPIWRSRLPKVKTTTNAPAADKRSKAL